MKLKFKAILFAAVAAFMSASCTEGIIDLRPELQDVEATSVELTTLVSSDAARVRPYNVYTLNLSNGDGSAVLNVKFVSDGQPLHAAAYNAATSGVSRNTYMTGATGTKLTLAGVVYQVVDGTIKVTEEAGVYSLSGVVAVVPEVVAEGETATRSYYNLSWAGTDAIKFKELPVMTKLTKLLSAQSNVANGTNTVTLQLATKDISTEWNAATYQNVLKGTGAYLAVDFYSEKGYLKAGTYKPSKDPKNPQAGEYVIGYDTTLEYWGQVYEMFDWGTCWWTVTDGKTVDANGKNTALKITTGDIVVALDGTTYTIDLDNGTQLAQFVGDIKNLVEPVKPANPFADMTADIMLEGKGLTMTMVDKTSSNTSADGAPLAGVTLYTVTLSDAAGTTVATLDLVTAEGAETVVGDYGVISYPDEVGEAGNGYYIDLSQWGMEGIMKGGTILYDRAGNANVVDAETSYIRVTESNGLTTILVKGTSNGKTISGKYVIGEEPKEDEGGEGEEGEGNHCGCDCDGCADCTGPGTGSGDAEGDAEEGEAEGEYVNLTTYINTSNYHAQYGNHLMGFELGTNGIVAEAWTYGDYSGVNAKGNGNVLKIEFYTADGKLAAGTYKPSAKNGELAEGEFNLGVEADYNGQKYVSGSAWQTYANDQKTAEAKISDGTVTVEVSGDVYTIIVKSSTVNAKYVGKLSN